MRKRDNLIAFRTTEGSALERIHQKAKADGLSIKAIIESWAPQFAANVRQSEEESDDRS